VIARSLLLAVTAFAFAGAPRAQTVAEVGAACESGAFDVAFAIRALDADEEHEEVARMAAAIVRHEWFELPAELFEGLDGRPRAQRRLLEEFARGPRRAAEPWLRQQAEPREGRSIDHRMLALAALGEPLDRAGANLLLDAVAAPRVGDGYYLALPLLSAKLADGLVGRMHQGLLAEKLDPERLTFLIDRLSRRGVTSLLGLCVTLDVEAADVLLRHVHDVHPELVHERAAAALDGDGPVEAIWLRFASHVLDRDARVQRVVDVLAADKDPERQRRALEALLSKGLVDRRTLFAALDGVDVDVYLRRVQRMLQRQPSAVPAWQFAAWLAEGGDVQAAAAKAACNRAVLEPNVQAALLDLLRGVESATRGVVHDAVLALTLRGDAAALQRIWPLIVSSPSWSDLLDRLGHRDAPFVYERLLVDLADGEPDGFRDERDEQRDMIRLLLVGHGDRRELATLVEHAPRRAPLFLRRCRHYAQRLEPEHVQQLYDAALAADDFDVAAELLEWVAHCGGDAARDKLWQLWNEPPEVEFVEELLEIAMRELSRGPRRGLLVERLRAQLGTEPLDEQLMSLPYELLNGMSDPPSPDDLRLCAELLLLSPCGDPAAERRRVARWPDGTFGFPLVSAIATRLRGTDAVAAERMFTEVVDGLADDAPRAAAISPQRLKVFWRALAAHRELLLPLGRQTSRLWRDHDDVPAGPARWFAALRAERAGDFDRAEQLYRQAGHAMLRRPDARLDARWLLGERDPSARRDPLAQLAAAPYRMQLLAARAAGDEAAARRAAARAREFAGNDDITLDTLTASTKESDR